MRTPELAEGRPWIDWIEKNMKPRSKALKDRQALYGFIHSLFRLDDNPSVDPENPFLQSLPRGMRPDGEAVASILTLMARRWEERGLERVHGAFDYWVVLAATSHVQAPSALWRTAKFLQALGRPKISLYLAKMLAVHLRGLPGHPIEHYGTPEQPQSGFVDAEILATILPGVIERFLVELQDQEPAKDLPEGVLPERTFYLWVIATALDPVIYLEHMAEHHVGRRHGYRERLLEELDKLGRPSRLNRLFREIIGTLWQKHGLRDPWLALARNQPSSSYQRLPDLSFRLRDPRPILPYKFPVVVGAMRPGATSPKMSPLLGDPALLNMDDRPIHREAFLAAEARYPLWRHDDLKANFRVTLAQDIKAHRWQAP